jgi:hypothetical protein
VIEEKKLPFGDMSNPQQALSHCAENRYYLSIQSGSEELAKAKTNRRLEGSHDFAQFLSQHFSVDPF